MVSVFTKSTGGKAVISTPASPQQPAPAQNAGEAEGLQTVEQRTTQRGEQSINPVGSITPYHEWNQLHRRSHILLPMMDDAYMFTMVECPNPEPDDDPLLPLIRGNYNAIPSLHRLLLNMDL